MAFHSTATGVSSQRPSAEQDSISAPSPSPEFARFPPPIELQISNQAEDLEWDEFVAKLDFGSHMQSSMWAQVKASVGWEVCRITARSEQRIVGGAQVLIRRVPVLGAIGYVPRGPLMANDDPVLMGKLLGALRATAKRERIRYMLVQPFRSQRESDPRFAEFGFRPSIANAAPTATVLLDLSRSLPDLLASMKGKTRYNIRVGLRKGVTVRTGERADIETFHRLLRATGQRNAFPTHSLEYYDEVWRVFARRDAIQLFVAEHDGKAVAALLALTFGKTVTYWRGAWAGQYGALHPNEALHWKAIEWAKARGCHWYDLDGIEVSQVKELVPESETASLPRTDTTFKMGFGGDYMLLPGAFEHIPNPALRWATVAFFASKARDVKSRIEAVVRGMTES